jgi:hypothetical protein
MTSRGRPGDERRAQKHDVLAVTLVVVGVDVLSGAVVRVIR